MKKRQIEYTPQFDFKNIENKKIELKECVQCGKPSVSLHNGRCFECRQQEEVSHRRTTEEYFKKQDKNKAIICTTILSAVCIALSLLFVLILTGVVPANKVLKEMSYDGLIGGITGAILSVLYWPIRKLLNHKNKMDDGEK